MPGLIAPVRLSRHSRPRGFQPRRSRPAGSVRRPAAAAACAAATIVLAAGCGSPAAGASGAQAITTAAHRAAAITSVTAAISVRVSGPATVTTTGTIRERLTPAPLLSMQLSSTLGGSPAAFRAVVTRSALYLHLGVLGQMLAKPWLEVPLTGASGGQSTFAQLLRSLTFSDPLGQARLLQAVRQAHRVGTADIDGVPTTQYSATYNPAQALPELSPSLRRQLGPQLRSIHGQVHLSIWIDGQHRVRRITETGRVAAEHLMTTITYSGYNQPVSITVPPASQVQSVSGLGQLGG
ncbi:MAG TPA: hypothetical protein VFV41_19735 [Streptosporangiaceae bacterium]|nr:hypothetical protein [Streptosporangiaceae bacterium]